MIDRDKLQKVWKIFLLLLVIAVIIFVAVTFKGEAPKILGAYYLLLARPEAFIVAAYAIGQSPILIFIQTFLFTTFMTFITWHLAGVVQKKIVNTQKEGKFNFLKKYKIANWAIRKHQKFQSWIIQKREKTLDRILKTSRYLIFVPFVFPFLPSIDTAAVVMAKIIKLPYAFWIFIGINAIKFILILLGCANLWS